METHKMVFSIPAEDPKKFRKIIKEMLDEDVFHENGVEEVGIF